MAAKMLSRFAFVAKLSPAANKRMKPITRAKRASGLVTKYRARVDPINRVAAMALLQMLKTKVRCRCEKCRVVEDRWLGPWLESPCAGPQCCSQRTVIAFSYSSTKHPMISE